MTALFKALDLDGSRTLDLKEFTKIIGHMEKKNRRQIENIDAETLANLNLQIDRLFRRVDKNNNGFLELSELHKLLKPLQPGQFSEADC